MAHLICLNSGLQGIYRGRLISIFLKPLFRFLFFLFLSIAGYSQAYALSLSGTVYGGSNPLPNSIVTLNDTSTGGLIGTVSTDSGGIYSFTSLSDGTYNLTVTPSRW